MCSSPVVNGETKQGGYAEYVLIQARAAVRVPAHIDAAKYAPVLCAGVTAFNTLRNMNIPVGETVAVQGLGGVGHMAIQYANRLGYRVVAISRDGSKEETARALGAHEYVDSSKGDVGEQLQKLGGARLIIVTAPTAEVAGPLLSGLGVLGKLLFLSVPGEITVNTFAMVSLPLQICASEFGTNSLRSLAKVFRCSAGRAVTMVIPRMQSSSPSAKMSTARLKPSLCLKQTRRTVSSRSSQKHLPCWQLINLIIGAMLSGNVRFKAVLVME
jgi:D-arabinose 1-dehydrogenase-like Zn-dependent alcohol dehydrogenase